MERTKWLDGLRGIAAAIVAFDHYFMSDVWHPFLSFWADPPELNRRLIQLPPIRILFGAHAMVTIFMVISGYAIAINIIKVRHSRPQHFWTRISSAVWRRPFRIYLPVLIISIITQFFFFFNMFHWNIEKEMLRGIEPWSNPWAHLKWLSVYMLDNINIITFQYRGGLNGQLWTMPVEFRGSCVVFLLIIGLASWRTNLRLWLLPPLSVYFLWFGTWDVFGFVWGLWLAERAVAKAENPTEEDSEEEKLPWPSHSYSTKSFARILLRKLTASRVITAVSFVVGYHLLCLGNDGHLTPGYLFLVPFIPARWYDNWDIIHWCVKTVGAAFLVYAISEAPILQRPFNTRLAQYLGHISFSLYLVHEGIYMLWRDPLVNFFWSMIDGSPYPGGGEGPSVNAFAFHVSWWLSGIIMGGIVLSAAHYYTIYVDHKCVAFTKRLEKMLTQQSG